MWQWDQQEPFGANPADEDPDANSVAFDLPLRLPGQRYDQETGLHYNYFRDYDPSLGRYGESDPIGIRGGLNTYVYVLGDPLRYVDVLGLALGDLPSKKPEDLLKSPRPGQGMSAKAMGALYGAQCAQICLRTNAAWVVANALRLCLEMIPAPVLASTLRNDVLFTCESTCKEQAPKICPPPGPQSSCEGTVSL